MDNILKEVDELVELIKQTPDYIEYLSLKERIVKDEDIMNLINEIKFFQKQIVRNGNDSNLEDKINDNLTKLNNYPIYVRFDELQKELNSLFQTIKFSIEDCVNDITN